MEQLTRLGRFSGILEGMNDKCASSEASTYEGFAVFDSVWHHLEDDMVCAWRWVRVGQHPDAVLRTIAVVRG
jgi:hypothetical protein